MGQLATLPFQHIVYFSRENDDGPKGFFWMPYLQTPFSAMENYAAKTSTTGIMKKNTNAFEFT